MELHEATSVLSTHLASYSSINTLSFLCTPVKHKYVHSDFISIIVTLSSVIVIMNSRIQLPSYQEATRDTVYDEEGKRSFAGVIELAVRHVDPKDHRSLCLVSKGIYAIFAHLLSKNPLRMIRALGLRPGLGKSRRRSSPSFCFSTYRLTACIQLPLGITSSSVWSVKAG